MKSIKNKLGIGKIFGTVALATTMLFSQGCLSMYAVQKYNERRDRLSTYEHVPCKNKITKRGKNWLCFLDDEGYAFWVLKKDDEGNFTYKLDGKTKKLYKDEVEIVK
ncbi:MAG TPA: hypothetical protein ENG87_04225 [Candidatus Pacearchaeota archaeon]|nr:hypothetical protein BMS3Abin17_00696 [archaeon BMS3Abin17]HDK42561.1 hypothetical protein [Candidatus Pacearchaeota archaeon]HDZ60991.1 hypothetical protein [Candidatus Pacearchaeota archaeon]